MRFELIIFDCDGVLVDSEEVANEVLAGVIGRYGLSLSPGEAHQIFVGQSVGAVRDMAMRELGVTLPHDWAIGYYQELFPALESVRAIEGVADVICQLQARKVPFCVASQGPLEKMEVTLGATKLAPFFAGRIYSAKSVRRPKPAPDLFIHAARSCGAKPGGCAVIEDSAAGVAAGIAAGMKVFAFCPPDMAPKFKALGATPFHSMSELLAKLEG